MALGELAPLFICECGGFVPDFHTLDEPGDADIDQAVEDVFAALFSLDDSGFFQDGQVLADGGKINLGAFHEVADTHFTLGQIADNPQPGRVPQCFKYFCQIGKLFCCVGCHGVVTYRGIL